MVASRAPGYWSDVSCKCRRLKGEEPKRRSSLRRACRPLAAKMRDSASGPLSSTGVASENLKVSAGTEAQEKQSRMDASVSRWVDHSQTDPGGRADRIRAARVKVEIHGAQFSTRCHRHMHRVDANGSVVWKWTAKELSCRWQRDLSSLHSADRESSPKVRSNGTMTTSGPARLVFLQSVPAS
jgi:hypothetical protein